MYNGLDTSFTSFPSDNESDPEAFKKAIDALPPGSAITIFTPDPTHYPIALYAIERKIHVLIKNFLSTFYFDSNIDSIIF